MGANGSRTGHAVVIGAGMGGLLAAQVLRRHFDRVTLVDRDELPAEAETRKGVPQGKHTHVLLARGRELLESLLPGFTGDVVNAGAPLCNLSRVRMYNDGHLSRRLTSPALMLMASRPLVETTVRRRVVTGDGITILTRHRVTGLTTTRSGNVVTGVTVTDQDGSGRLQDLEGDLVVDASGRSSHLPQWLEELGFAAPPEEHVQVGLMYSTRHYRRRPGDLDGDLVVLVGPTGATHRVGVLCANEDDRWTVSIAGYSHDHPPTEPQAYHKFAAGLARPDIADAIAGMEPLSDPVPHRYQSSRRMRYEKLRRFPEGLLVFGDALCSFNPIFGQGMSVAALEADALRGCLDRGFDGLAPRFFKQAARAIDIPWEVSVGADLRFPEVEGRRTMKVRIANAYSTRVARAAAVDDTVADAFGRVINLYDRPERLLRPGIARRVLAAGLTRRTPPPVDAPPAVDTIVAGA